MKRTYANLPRRIVREGMREFLEDVLDIRDYLQEALAGDADLCHVCIEAISHLEYVAYCLTSPCVEVSEKRLHESRKLAPSSGELTVILPNGERG